MSAGILLTEKNDCPSKKIKYNSFTAMRLFGPLHKAIMKRGYRVPTPIQRKLIPKFLAGFKGYEQRDLEQRHDSLELKDLEHFVHRDIVAMSRTGSGKTCSYVIPIVERLRRHSITVGARALILVPTRELGYQVLECVKEMCVYTDLRSVVLVGGEKCDKQYNLLIGNPDILICSPGRLLQILKESPMDLRKTLEFVIIDEADRLFEVELLSQLHELMRLVKPLDRGTDRYFIIALFSATLPKNMAEFTRIDLSNPDMVRLDVDSQLNPDVNHYFIHTRPCEKEAFLVWLLSDVSSPIIRYIGRADPYSKGIIFVSTRHHVEYLHYVLGLYRIEHAYLYGNMDGSHRNEMIDKYRRPFGHKDGFSNLLVVTDLAARGIDLPNVKWCVNYDFTANEKLFVHRVGRVGRTMGMVGEVFSCITNDDIPYLVDLSLYCQRSIITNADKDHTDFSSAFIIGAPFRDTLCLYIETINTYIREDDDLKKLYESMQNAFGLYGRTKKKASSNSYDVAKSLSGCIGIHPLFKGIEYRSPNPSLADETKNMMDSIKNYRPTETVFEMKESKFTGDVIGRIREKVKTKRSGVENNVFQNWIRGETNTTDKEFFLTYERPGSVIDRGLSIYGAGNFARLSKEAGFDITNDEKVQKSEKKERKQREDQREKKNDYEMWKSRTNLDIQCAGELEKKMSGSVQKILRKIRDEGKRDPHRHKSNSIKTADEVLSKRISGFKNRHKEQKKTKNTKSNKKHRR